MRILGIDPGIGTTGYGVVDRSGNQVRPVAYGVITTPPDEASPGKRLLLLSERLRTVIDEFGPEAAALERLFFSRNVTTAMSVSQARGVILLELARACVPCTEYTPNQVKQGVTGSGRSGKSQVRTMVARLLALDSVTGPDDAADALALALTWHPDPLALV